MIGAGDGATEFADGALSCTCSAGFIFLAWDLASDMVMGRAADVGYGASLAQDGVQEKRVGLEGEDEEEGSETRREGKMGE